MESFLDTDKELQKSSMEVMKEWSNFPASV